ncbi:S-adenosyl-L-methionine-dependent methyltransferase-like protein [Senna tora]|uniref:S-adenosyl-L-methionine-dependent methyltransferase-like protein n=1 Tax=Senna tora TaxID=362788 RepID=A0A834SLS0_9FABA|nr:S-adenosyl-L-methionine-dependent methyltransferase-like protein [Senna tora]
MDRQIQVFLNRLSWVSIAIASLTLLHLFLQTPETCVPPDAPSKPHLRFPKSSCDFSSRAHVPLDKKNKRLWSSKEWQKKVTSYIQFFKSIQDLSLLNKNSRVLCVSAGAGHEVMALTNSGVLDVTGIELIDSPPLVSRADPHNLPFFDDSFDFAFSAHLAEALFPSRFASEMERTVQAGGVCLIVVEECGDDEVKEIVSLFKNSRFISANNVTLIGLKMTSIIMRTRNSP